MDQVRIAQGGDGGQPRLSVGERIVPLPLHEGFFQRMYNPVSVFSLEQSQINLTHSCTTIYITVEYLQKLP